MLPRKGKAPCTEVPSDDEDELQPRRSAAGKPSREQACFGLRQLRPDAQDQRVAASKAAAAAKRSAGAMPKEELRPGEARQAHQRGTARRVSRELRLSAFGLADTRHN